MDLDGFRMDLDGFSGITNGVYESMSPKVSTRI